MGCNYCAKYRRRSCCSHTEDTDDVDDFDDVAAVGDHAGDGVDELNDDGMKLVEMIDLSLLYLDN